MVRWIFERNGSAITCEIEMTAERRCDVAIIPHWDAAASIVERFDGPMSAMARHAMLAKALLEDGWTVADRVS